MKFNYVKLIEQWLIYSSKHYIHRLSNVEHMESDQNNSHANEKKQQVKGGPSRGALLEDFQNSGSISVHLEQSMKYEFKREENEGGNHNDQPDESDYYCMTCHQNYNIKMSLCTHKRSLKQRYRCQFTDCQKEFTIQSGLSRHKMTHTGLKPYQCDFDRCDQKFNQKSNLNRHRRIHTQQKPFICDKCCKAFTTTTNLKQHVQVHFEDKQKRKKYICQIKGCNKEYFYMCNLKKHKQQHEDPVGECLVQKKPDFPMFSFNIGTCNFRISQKKNKQHSERLITYNQAQGNSITYKMQDFQKTVDDVHREHGNQEQQAMENNYLEDLQNVLRKILQECSHANNITFQMHEGLSMIANMFVKAMINILAEINLKVFALIMPSYNVFRDVVQNLLFEVQPKQTNQSQ